MYKLPFWVYWALALCLLCGWAMGGTYSGGAGTSASPYQIATLADLVELEQTTGDHASTKYYIQTATINAAMTNHATPPEAWGAGTYTKGTFKTNGGVAYVVKVASTVNEPPHADWWTAWTVGSTEDSNHGWSGGIGGITAGGFQGHYDGDGFAITNLHGCRIYQIGGFFSSLSSDAVVQDLSLTTYTFYGVSRYGALVGVNNGKISGCSTSGTLTGTAGTRYGGLVGVNLGTIIDCSTAGTLTAVGCRLGGLVGTNGADACYDGFDSSSGVIYRCSSSATVASDGEKDGESGGLVGMNAGTILQSFATGAVHNGAGSYSTGGLVGLCEGGTISHCYATGAVTGDIDVGGLIGETAMWFGLTIINYSYATGAVTSSDSDKDCYAGGFIGLADNASISHCYSTGAITSTGDQIGGFVGRSTGTDVATSFSSCYATGAVTGDGYVGGFIGGGDVVLTIDDCYCIGSVTGDNTAEAGFFAGSALVGGTITHSFYNSQTGGPADHDNAVSGVTAATTSEMGTQGTFTDWTFSASQWYMSGGYPKFYFVKYWYAK